MSKGLQVHAVCINVIILHHLWRDMRMLRVHFKNRTNTLHYVRYITILGCNHHLGKLSLASLRGR